MERANYLAPNYDSKKTHYVRFGLHKIQRNPHLRGTRASENQWTLEFC